MSNSKNQNHSSDAITESKTTYIIKVVVILVIVVLAVLLLHDNAKAPTKQKSEKGSSTPSVSFK